MFGADVDDLAPAMIDKVESRRPKNNKQGYLLYIHSLPNTGRLFLTTFRTPVPKFTELRCTSMIEQSAIIRTVYTYKVTCPVFLTMEIAKYSTVATLDYKDKYYTTTNLGYS